MTTKFQVLKAIREKCLDCCCDSHKEVTLCQVKDCTLYPFRFGKDPVPAKKGQGFGKVRPAHDDLISKNENE